MNSKKKNENKTILNNNIIEKNEKVIVNPDLKILGNIFWKGRLPTGHNLLKIECIENDISEIYFYYCSNHFFDSVNIGDEMEFQLSNLFVTNNFKKVKIGDQIWMAQNLNADHFNNGDPIFEARNPKDWQRAVKRGKPAWCYFNYDIEKGKIFGKLYNWYAISDARGLVPKGWHIPSLKEWQEMKIFLGVNANSQLKSNFGWNENRNGIDKFGFQVLPSGLCFGSGNFSFEGKDASFWSKTENDYHNAWNKIFYDDIGEAYFDNDDLERGYSVRAVKDSKKYKRDNYKSSINVTLLWKETTLTGRNIVKVENNRNKYSENFYAYCNDKMFNSLMLLDEISIPTKALIPSTEFSSIKVGDHIWMCENLNVNCFRNGEPIRELERYDGYSSETIPMWCYYDYYSDNGNINGKLYNRFAVADSRGIAPTGWHIASDKEWISLNDNLIIRRNLIGQIEKKVKDNWYIYIMMRFMIF